MRPSGLLLAIVLLLTTAAMAAAAPAYRLLTLDGAYLKWGKPALGTGAVITYSLAARLMSFDKATNCRRMAPFSKVFLHSHITRRQALTELKAAFATWQAVADVKFVPATPGAAADIIIGAEAVPLGRAFTNVAYERDDEHRPGTDKALTSLRPVDLIAPVKNETSAPAHSIAQSLICLNPDEPWKVGFDGNLHAYDLRYAFIHEIGHSIGLDHPGAHGEIMSFKYLELFRTPQAGDIAGVVRLYGAARRD